VNYTLHPVNALFANVVEVLDPLHADGSLSMVLVYAYCQIQKITIRNGVEWGLEMLCYVGIFRVYKRLENKCTMGAGKKKCNEVCTSIAATGCIRGPGSMNWFAV
jgi:hypothetical protein